MSSYRLTPAAVDDIFEISAYIAAEDLPAAERLELEFSNSCQRAADKPDLGHFRRDRLINPCVSSRCEERT